MSIQLEQFMQHVVAENPHEPEFHQAVHEVAESLLPVLDRHPVYIDEQIMYRIIEPERVLMFRVPWLDDTGRIRVNKGYRIQMNSAIGPYKGGLRFAPHVNLSVLKFLAFEQVFKNALTTLPMGGGKGGSNFDPLGKSDREVLRFCQSFMTELCRHIGPDTDVPAGDIGVGKREIGYLFGQYKRIRNAFQGVLTGKGFSWGGSLIRPEATGYGVVFFAGEMLRKINEGIKGKTCLVSGAGNVALHAAEKIIQLGGKVVSLSDIKGAVYDPDGINEDKLAWTKQLVFERRGFLEEYAEHFKVEYVQGKNVWGFPGAEIAFPCATQNELSLEDAQQLAAGGIRMVCEGANMPTRPDAIRFLQEHGVLFAPGKAANAGGVAVSGLEMAQNSQRIQWTAVEVEDRLFKVMQSIHRNCVTTAANYGAPGNYVIGANVAGFLKVAEAMVEQGPV